MKQIQYIPKQCQEGGDFTGHVLVRVPLFDERYEIIDQMGLKLDQETGEMKMADLNSFAAIRKMVTASMKFYVGVEIKHADGREFKSKDDLLSDPDCDAILIDVAMAVSRGFKMGKT
jgi:hypothetical protein